MMLPENVKIGKKEYLIRQCRYLFNDSIGGSINYNTNKIKVRRSMDSIEKERCLFHEIAHGVIHEMILNYPQLAKFKSDEAFIDELGLTLRKTFLSFTNKTEELKNVK